MTIINTIYETEGVRLIKRVKGQRDNHKYKLDSTNIAQKAERKNSIRTMLKDSTPSFSFNLNLLYPK